MQSLHLVTCCLVAICLTGCAAWSGQGAAASDMNAITGTVTYREKIALPANAVLSVTLGHITQQDGAPILVSEVSFAPQQPVPIPFALEYDPQSIDDRQSYAVHATIRSGEELLFVTEGAIPVLTHGHGEKADIVLVRSNPSGTVELTGTRWRLRRLGGEDVAPASADRAPYLQLDGTPPDLTVSGHGGCNTFRGTAKQDASTLQFGPLASTKMACPDMQLEGRFQSALSATRSWQVREGQLVLSGDDGELARFEASGE